MPDLPHIIQASAVHAWLYLPVAVILGALHALEPGHAKSLMAAYIVSIRGTAGQAALLGASAAAGHTIVVWMLAILGLVFGNALIVEQAEPWLTLLSGILIILLAIRLIVALRRKGVSHAHDHHHEHDHGHRHHDDHAHDHHHRAAKPSARTGDIVWFGFTGGLLPCPSAIAVLLICLQLRQFMLGVLMVAAFSIGLAATLMGIGIAAAWGARRASVAWPWFERAASRAPYVSAGLVMIVGLVMTAVGLNATGLLASRKSN
jgi:nickel/cobalt transporter (NicO) family protein